MTDPEFDDPDEPGAKRVRWIWLVLVALTVVVLMAEFTYVHFRDASSTVLSHHVARVPHADRR